MQELTLPKGLFFVHDKDNALTFEACIVGLRVGENGNLWLIKLSDESAAFPFDPHLGQSPGGVFLKGFIPGGLCLPFDNEHPHALARDNLVDGTGGCYRLPGIQAVQGKPEG